MDSTTHIKTISTKENSINQVFPLAFDNEEYFPDAEIHFLSMNTTISIHRLLLCSHSSFFKNCFSGSFQEAKTKKVTMREENNFYSQLLFALIRSVYTGYFCVQDEGGSRYVPIHEWLIFGIIVSDKYGFGQLEKIFINHSKSFIKQKNDHYPTVALDAIMHLGPIHQSKYEELLEISKQAVQKNRSQILSTYEIDNVSFIQFKWFLDAIGRKKDYATCLQVTKDWIDLHQDDPCSIQQISELFNILLKMPEDFPFPVDFRFTSGHYPGGISQGGKTATNQGRGGMEFYWMDQSLEESCSWRIKIDRMRSWIAISVAVRDQIPQQSGQWYNGRNGHGFYGIMSNGNVLQHTRTGNYNGNRHFQFNQGDVIEVTYDAQEHILDFYKISNAEFRLEQVEGKSLCPAVILNNNSSASFQEKQDK